MFAGADIASSGFHPAPIRLVMVLSETLDRESWAQEFAVFVSPQALILVTLPLSKCFFPCEVKFGTLFRRDKFL
jgi:hypothetical protein